MASSTSSSSSGEGGVTGEYWPNLEEESTSEAAEIGGELAASSGV